MGKVKELLAELAETFSDMLWHTDTWSRAIDQMAKILPPDEFEFFEEHIDVIKEMIGMGDEHYQTNDEKDVDQYELGPGDGGLATFRKNQEDEKHNKRFKRMPESLEMPSIEEFINEGYYDESYYNEYEDDPYDDYVEINGKKHNKYDLPAYKNINGKWLHTDSREYQKWYREEGEFDDTEGRSYRRSRY